MEFQTQTCSSRTLSLQLIAEPITKQVRKTLTPSPFDLISHFGQIAELDKLMNSRRGGSGFPDVVSTSAAIREAVCKLHQIATTEISKSQDKVRKITETIASVDGCQ